MHSDLCFLEPLCTVKLCVCYLICWTLKSSLVFDCFIAAFIMAFYDAHFVFSILMHWVLMFLCRLSINWRYTTQQQKQMLWWPSSTVGTN